MPTVSTFLSSLASEPGIMATIITGFAGIFTTLGALVNQFMRQRHEIKGKILTGEQSQIAQLLEESALMRKALQEKVSSLEKDLGDLQKLYLSDMLKVKEENYRFQADIAALTAQLSDLRAKGVMPNGGESFV